MSVIKFASQSLSRLSRAQLSLHNYTVINRFLATSENSAKSKKKTVQKIIGWEPIYKFAYVQSLASFNRLKVYQFGLTAVAVPLSFAIPTILDPLIVASIGASGAVTLSLASYAFKNTVGFVYTNPTDSDLVRFAHVTFWGGRKDVEMKIDEVVPFSQLPRSIIDSRLSILQFKNGQPNMKLLYKYGGVIDCDEFSRVFGEDNS